jgi:hypothetical protein
MCPNLSQPEEVDLALKEIENVDMRFERQRANMEPVAGAAPKGVNTTNCSAYRAEYMRTHHLDP